MRRRWAIRCERHFANDSFHSQMKKKLAFGFGRWRSWNLELGKSQSSSSWINGSMLDWRLFSTRKRIADFSSGRIICEMSFATFEYESSRRVWCTDKLNDAICYCLQFTAVFDCFQRKNNQVITCSIRFVVIPTRFPSPSPSIRRCETLRQPSASKYSSFSNLNRFIE